MNRFVPIEQQLYHPDLGTYISYGIAALQFQSGRCKLLAFVGDISDSFEAVAALAELCTKEQLAPAQLWDIAEDFLCK